MRKTLGWLGGVVTILYLIGLAFLIHDRVGQLWGMPLNELGDFLAGAFGPVAFLWLVLGFIQQGQELRQGTEALMLQASELKNSVEQQTIMAAAASQQIEASDRQIALHAAALERAMAADFRLGQLVSGGGNPQEGSRMFQLRLQNSGSIAYKTLVEFIPPIGTPSIIKREIVEKDTKFDLEIPYPMNPRKGICEVSYEGGDGKHRKQRFEYSVTPEQSLNFDRLHG